MRLDEEALIRLRSALEEVQSSSGRTVPREVLARLSDALPSGVGMTVDFDAARTLGHPVVILRPTTTKVDDVFAVLTAREKEVAGLVATGLRNKDIAIALGITVATVKDHVHRILHKTGLDSRTAVAALWNP